MGSSDTIPPMGRSGSGATRRKGRESVRNVHEQNIGTYRKRYSQREGKGRKRSGTGCRKEPTANERMAFGRSPSYGHTVRTRKSARKLTLIFLWFISCQVFRVLDPYCTLALTRFGLNGRSGHLSTRAFGHSEFPCFLSPYTPQVVTVSPP